MGWNLEQLSNSHSRLKMFVIFGKHRKIVRIGSKRTIAIFSTREKAEKALNWGNLKHRECYIVEMQEV